MSLFVRLGHGLGERRAAARRAAFLQGLIGDSKTFTGTSLKVSPCSAAQAYCLFVAITGCLGVGIDAAAARLERVVRSQ